MFRPHHVSLGCYCAASTLLSLGAASAGARAPALTTNANWNSSDAILPQTYFVGSNSELYSMVYPYNPGQFAQITGVDGRPPLAPGSGATAITGIDGLYNVFYLTQVNGSTHIEQLMGRYEQIDASLQANTPAKQLPAGNTPLIAYTDNCAGTDNVFYVDVNHHLELLHWSPTTWEVTDLTKLTNAPVVQGEALAGHEGAFAKEVFYVSSNGHVHQLWAWSSCPGGYAFDGWHKEDLTSLSSNSAPLALKNSPLTSYHSSGSQTDTDAVFYVDQQHDLQQLYISPQISPIGSWTNIAVGQLTGVPPVGNGSALASQVYQTNTDLREQVYYVADTGAIVDLQSWFPDQELPLPAYMWFGDAFPSPGFKSAAATTPIAADVNVSSCLSNCEPGDFFTEVYYITPAGHVQLATYSQIQGPNWAEFDITSSTGAPKAVP